MGLNHSSNFEMQEKVWVSDWGTWKNYKKETTLLGNGSVKIRRLLLG